VKSFLPSEQVVCLCTVIFATCNALVVVMVGRVECLMGIHSHKETLMANECSVWILFERVLSQSAVWSRAWNWNSKLHFAIPVMK
jgi:hypothetical protein